jgi:hypothetical protein
MERCYSTGRSAHKIRAVRISNLRLDRSGGAARASATVVWEEARREPLELFYECAGSGADDLSPEPEAFAAACLPPAMRDGERRVLVEGTLCPELARGAAAALSLLRSWNRGAWRPVSLEAQGGLRPAAPPLRSRNAVYLTGGVDSRHLIVDDRSRHRAGDPAGFADALSLFGHLCADDPRPREWDAAVAPILTATAARQGLELVRVRTNSWRLAPNVPFISRVSLTSALAAPAHLFPGRWSRISIASSRDEKRSDHRAGYHPQLPPAYSSAAVRIRHVDSQLTRDDRLRVLAGMPGEIEDLVVCLAYPGPPYVNCGECEKCVRTMVELLAIGALGRAARFPVSDVEPARILGIPIRSDEEDYWRDLLPALARIGRGDLVAAVREKLEEMRRYESWARDEGWKGRLRRLDRRFFGGRLVEARKKLLT